MNLKNQKLKVLATSTNRSLIKLINCSSKASKKVQFHVVSSWLLVAGLPSITRQSLELKFWRKNETRLTIKTELKSF